jgi:surfeit locus 1 family protein
MTTRRFPWGLTLAALIGFSILIALGVWQLQRLEWKQRLIARRAALETSAPVPVGRALSVAGERQDLDSIRVTAICPGLGAAPFVELFGNNEGRVVYRLISACRLEGAPYESILVDRGAIPEEVEARPAVDPSSQAPVGVTGVLADTGRPRGAIPDPGGLWTGRNIAAMAEQLGAGAPAPVFLFAETSSNPELAELAPGLPSAPLSNRHLEYALTWFALAAVLAYIYAAMLWRRMKAQ